jgi:hypothetical protein
VDLFYDPSWAERESSSIPESKCRFKVVGSCKEFSSPSNTEWFLDEDKGGPNFGRRSGKRVVKVLLRWILVVLARYYQVEMIMNGVSTILMVL